MIHAGLTEECLLDVRPETRTALPIYCFYHAVPCDITVKNVLATVKFVIMAFAQDKEPTTQETTQVAFSDPRKKIDAFLRKN